MVKMKFEQGIKTLDNLLLNGGVKEKYFGSEEGIYHIYRFRVDEKCVILDAEIVAEWDRYGTRDLGEHKRNVNLNLSEHLRDWEFVVNYSL